jgi:hypothetical protein
VIEEIQTKKFQRGRRKMKIKIEWLYDEHDCETCGSSYATGARVQIGNDSLMFDPIAHCYDGASWTMAEVYESILKHLGHELEVEDL